MKMNRNEKSLVNQSVQPILINLSDPGRENSSERAALRRLPTQEELVRRLSRGRRRGGARGAEG